MVKRERQVGAEASQDDVNLLARALRTRLRTRYPLAPIDRQDPPVYDRPTIDHLDEDASLVASGQYAPTIRLLSEKIQKHLVTAEGRRIKLSVVVGEAVGAETKQPYGRRGRLLRYEAIYPDAEGIAISSAGVAELPEEGRGLVIDAYIGEQSIDVWSGLLANNHHRATAQEVLEAYNSLELANEVPRPQ